MSFIEFILDFIEIIIWPAVVLFSIAVIWMPVGRLLEAIAGWVQYLTQKEM